MKPLKHSMAFAAAATLLTVAPAALATNGYFAHGYGIRTKALAGAGIALPQDSLSIATNPAGLTELNTRVDVGLDWFKPKRGASITGNSFGPDDDFSGNDTESFLIPELGYNHKLNDSLSAGIAVYGNGGMNTDYKDNPFKRYGAQGDAGVDLVQLFVSPALAWRIDDVNSVGIAINAAYQRFRARGLGLFGSLSEDPSNVSNNGYDSSKGWSARLGWQARLGPYLTLGVTWQSKTEMSDFDKYQGLFAESGGFDIPENYGVGLAFHPDPALDVALDYQRINYSNVKSVANDLSTLFAKQLGDDAGPGFGWRDSEIIKLGVDYRLNNTVTLRAGYSDAKQPIPASETFFNILAPGIIRKHATLGLGWKIGASEISATWMHGFKETIHGRNSIPSAFGGGDADIYLKEDSFGIAWGYNL